MADSSGIHMIRSLQKKWLLKTALSYLLLSLAICLLVTTVLVKFASISWAWGIPVWLLISALFFVSYKSWSVSESKVALFLNEQFPQLEESTNLILRPYDSLNMLEKLQLKKVEQTITVLPPPAPFNKKIRRSSLVLAAMLVASVLLFFLPIGKGLTIGPVSLSGNGNDPTKERILPAIASALVTIKPPAYTGRPLRTQSTFNIRAEEGADISWSLQTTVATDSMQLILNGLTAVPLRRVNNDNKSWELKKNIIAPGFYQVKIGDKLSELYKIELTKDTPPLIHIRYPKSYTVIDYGQPQQVPMNVTIEDDYGVKEASIFATTTTGNGEGVKFSEQKLSFPNFSSGSRSYNLQKLLDLPALGVHPGDELYFYVRSVDNHNQESRSDMYMVSIPDTAQLMSLEGLGTGVNLKPEYFRSERQIIIETEQLLKDQKTVTAEQFRDKSNDLGIDQKLLRLRYSKFLGEEAESEGHGHADEHEGENNADNFGNAEKIMDEVSHKHDNAEDASFFDAQTKKQLKAILDEMWKAELKLRTLKPQEALPFEYKALRLLKDLQEKGRSYVAKSSYKTTPLKPEKRLSGDLSKIAEPVTKTEFKKKANPDDDVRRALGILETLRAGKLVDKSSFETLQLAGVLLNRKAAAEPALYLSSVGAMNRLLEATGNTSTAYSATDITAAQKGLYKMVSSQSPLPDNGNQAPDQNLSQQYFRNLKQGSR